MVQAVKGTKDLYGADMVTWVKMEETIRKVCETFCIGEIRTPMFEYTELFVKSTGETTDIVQKEMYTFTDKGDRSITLKPEVTAAVVRAVIEHKMYADTPIQKYFYLSPCFRYEKPQTGRLRQFHQFGAEYFGSYDAACDAEMIALADSVLKALGIKTTLYINSLGHSECRGKYNKELKDFLLSNKSKLCPTCVDRLEKNPLRVLDCKDVSCHAVLENAPSIIELLGPECRKHFDTTLEILKQLGVEAVTEPKMVRGLDYYTRTVFEFVSDEIGAQGSVCGGGRYDNLMEESGGPAMAGIGFAMGMERLMLCLKNSSRTETAAPPDLFLGAIGEKGIVKAQVIANELRQKGVKTEAEFSSRSVKAQMKTANKSGARYAVIIGGDELSTNTAKLKNMESGEEKTVSLSELRENIR